MKITFGTAGNIASGIENSIKKLKQIGLNSQEVEFVRGVSMSDKLAKSAGKVAKENKIKLTIHAPYYINLASKEPKKIEASKKRILDSCKKAHLLGATHVVFHAAFYQKKSPEEIYEIVKKSILEMQEVLKKNGITDVKLAPETTGKSSQFGSLDELLKLRKETGCDICIDWSHIYARNIGKIDYKEIFEKLNENNIKEVHCHFSGIEFTEKGERRHIPVENEFILSLLKEAKLHEINLNIICESPYPLEDALMMQKLWENLKSKNK